MDLVWKGNLVWSKNVKQTKMKNKTNAREHFPEGELTLDKNVVLWNENERN